MGLFRKLFSVNSTPEAPARKMRRNEACWCGSGEKYKRCHHDADRRQVSRKLAASCRTGG